NYYPVDIVANEDVELLYIHKNGFLKILQLNTTVLMNYLNIISTKSQFLSTKIKFLSFQTIKVKFAHYILNLGKQIKKDYFVLPLSQLKLSDLFGVSRPALSRVIRELHKENIINAEGKNIKILNKQALLELIK
nr:Crp/Fnr family transcriptional regulator [Bacteroidales bacterium]